MSQVAEHRVKVPGASSEDSRDFYPYQCARRLAAQLGTTLAELPGNHAGMIQQPGLFAARLRSLLRSPASRAAAGVQDGAEVTK